MEGVGQMDFESFVQGSLLWVVVLIFIAGLAARVACNGYALFKNLHPIRFSWSEPFITQARLLFPLHKVLIKKPVYTVLLYAFHPNLIVIPVWLNGHIVLWEESRFEWYWTPLPDEWIDWMTLFVIGTGLFFLCRHVVSKKRQLHSASSDYLLICITVLPFITGYCLTHGSLDAIIFFRDNMQMLHVLSAEAMLLVIVFLFCRIHLKTEKCTGCVACELSCPAEALEAEDKEILRYLNYVPYRCIYCGTCVTTCPEEAAELRHAIGVQTFLQPMRRQVIRTVTLQACEICKAPFGPEPQLEKVGRTINADYMQLCPRCKTGRVAGVLFQMGFK